MPTSHVPTSGKTARASTTSPPTSPTSEAAPYYCEFCKRTAGYDGPGPHECLECSGPLLLVAAEVEPLKPVKLLYEMARWLSASGFSAEHPWQLSIASTLSAEEDAERLDAVVNTAAGDDESGPHRIKHLLLQAGSVMRAVSSALDRENPMDLYYASRAISVAVGLIDTAWEITDELPAAEGGAA